MTRTRKIRKQIAALAAFLMLVGMLAGCSAQPKEQGIPVRVLILPKFEAGELTGDFPGEAQLFYEAYLAGGEVYEFTGATQLSTTQLDIQVQQVSELRAGYPYLIRWDNTNELAEYYLLGTGGIGTILEGHLSETTKQRPSERTARMESNPGREPIGQNWAYPGPRENQTQDLAS